MRSVTPYRLVTVPYDGPRFTEWTLRQMAAKVPPALRRYELVLVARRIVTEAGAVRDPAGQVSAIHEWVQASIAWVPDPVGVELVQDPEETIRVGCGDCDDFAVLVAALAGAVGLPARFRAVATTDAGFDHVWCEVLVGDEWLAADASVQDADVGATVPHVAAMLLEVRYY